MGQGAMENIQTIVITGIFIVVFIVLLFSLVFSKSQNASIGTKGAQVALAERILASDCPYEKTSSGAAEQRIFNKGFLDKNNNSAIPCLDFPGSFYFIKIEANRGLTWYLNSTKINPYIYNTALRGVTAGCTDDYGEQKIEKIDSQSTDGFDYARGKNILERYGTILDGEKKYSARISIVIDADSGFKNTLYPTGYPLCICNIPCPAESCACAKGCPKTNAGAGESCS